MTSDAKIDPALSERMRRKPTSRLPVLIEMAEQPEVRESLDRRSEMDSLSRQAEGAGEGVVEQLHGLGVSDKEIELFAIVSAVAVNLTPEQIRAMARRADVKLVRYNGPADVAL